jgi:hypothetical protein
MIAVLGTVVAFDWINVVFRCVAARIDGRRIMVSRSFFQMHFKNLAITAVVLAAASFAAPAAAVTNLIKNGSFEAGAVGTGGFLQWTKSNVPSNAPASVINYNSTASYPNGAFGESVFADNSVSASPDAVGGKAAYFVGDLSVNETISQLTYLRVGNYRLGFSYFLIANGLANPGNSSFRATIIGAPVAATAIISGAPGRVWQNVSGVGQITQAGYYTTAFVFNSNLGGASKDIVIDRAFAVATTDPATIIIPPTPTVVPEPSSWALLLLGFGFVGLAARRRKTVVAA